MLGPSSAAGALPACGRHPSSSATSALAPRGWRAPSLRLTGLQLRGRRGPSSLQLAPPPWMACTGCRNSLRWYPSSSTFNYRLPTTLQRESVLLLELVSVQESASGTPSSLTPAEALTKLALQCMTNDRAAPNMSSVAAKVYNLFLEV
ncbi:hypothetical protein CFC21_007290 [Triticum aestivum]|uniref:Uncharacterized protein n=2 Tax=Triticum aestivum TaxID=4565 RepID=A0A3B5YSS0_WHEAT|nr:uncharacterized protein LOC119319200 isoform X1 [Triticum dicoccoides]KAF6990037.1 hypothetical protein CFC21_007290 [Triticum aestivum]